MKKRLLFINQKQFGYHIAYVQFCKFLKQDIEISYLCWDHGKKKITESDINTIYVSRQGNIVARNFRFISEIVKHIRNNSYHQIFVNYFRGCSIIPVLFNHSHRVHLNIVTGSISINIYKRFFYNFILKCESLSFKSVSVLSEGLRDLLKLRKSTIILPLGATPLYVDRKVKTELCLLYVGTFTNRNIEHTVEGLGLFVQQYPNAEIQYIIIGNGLKDESGQIDRKIREFNLADKVELKGYIPYNELVKYYEIANVGVSYVPITPVYEFQPVTKTYEYLMSGIPVIATDTFENRRVINSHNGILIKDNPESFSRSLVSLYTNDWLYDEHIIRDSVSEFEWEKIVEKMKHTILA